jgi:hypothetical protein
LRHVQAADLSRAPGRRGRGSRPTQT